MEKNKKKKEKGNMTNSLNKQRISFNQRWRNEKEKKRKREKKRKKEKRRERKKKKKNLEESPQKDIKAYSE